MKKKGNKAPSFDDLNENKPSTTTIMTHLDPSLKAGSASGGGRE